MAGLGKFIGISLVFHMLFLFALLGIRTQAEPYGSSVYEVSIVSLPSAGGHASSRSVYTRSMDRLHAHKEALPEPGKEMSIKGKAIDIKPPEIKPPEYMAAALGTSSPETTQAKIPGGSNLSKEVGVMGGNRIAVYKSIIRNIIRKRWKVPPEMAISRGTLKASYMIKISRNGGVLDRKLIMSSGNRPYDRSILMALNSIDRLPVPPLELIAGSDTLEIIMTFTSEEMED